MFVLLFIVFFKQKTAYEMRISDWSSDVCSSDLDRCQLIAVQCEILSGMAVHQKAGQAFCLKDLGEMLLQLGFIDLPGVFHRADRGGINASERMGSWGRHPGAILSLLRGPLAISAQGRIP